MSNSFKDGLPKIGMRYVWLLFGILFLLSACSGSPNRGAAGSGVQTILLNAHALNEVYFNYNSQLTEITADGIGFKSEGEYVYLTDLNFLLHNQGYADTIAAVYVSGYDPNLFFLYPKGPYVFQQGNRFCFQDVQIQSEAGWNVYAVCERGEDLVLGGGLSGNADGEPTGFRIDAYNADLTKFLDKLPEKMKGEWIHVAQRTGLLTDLDISCYGSAQDENWKVWEYSIQCPISWGSPQFYFQRSSRGALALALYGQSVRDCKNDCIVVPPLALRDKYLAGDTELYPGGEAAQVDIGVLLDRGVWPPNLNDHVQPFQITSCSLYTTYATPEICVDPTPATSDAEVCRPGVQRLITQPAPLQITRIDQVNQGSQIMFTVHVKQDPSGTLFDPGAIDYCAPGAPERFSREVRDVARVLDARVLGSMKAMDCRDGIIHLNNGEGRINCFYEIPSTSFGRPAYQTTANFEIAYLFREQHTVAMEIHRT